MNIFKEMVLSIYSYKTYQEFLKNKKGKIFGFAIVLMAIYFAIKMLLPFAEFQITTGGFANLIEENVPEFELKDGYLQIEEAIEFREGGSYIYIDTDPNSYFYDVDEIEEYLYDYSKAILIDSEKVIVKDDGQIKGLYFEDLNADFSKDDLIKLIPYVYVYIILFLIIAFIWMTGLFFLGVLFTALLGMIAASCMKKQLTFGQLYILGIYSRTLPLLIKAVAGLLPFNIPFFFIINFGISLIILILVMQNMKEQNESGETDQRNNNDFSWMQ